MDLHPVLLVYVATRKIEAGEEIVVGYHNNESKSKMADGRFKVAPKSTILEPLSPTLTPTSLCCNGPSCRKKLNTGERIFSCRTCWDQGIKKDLCDFCFCNEVVKERVCQHAGQRWELCVLSLDQQSGK
jgi:hypothetical protein